MLALFLFCILIYLDSDKIFPSYSFFCYILCYSVTFMYTFVSLQSINIHTYTGVLMGLSHQVSHEDIIECNKIIINKTQNNKLTILGCLDGCGMPMC